MLVNFRCRRCRRSLSVESDQKGNTIQCPGCQCEMVAPAVSEPNAPRGQILAGIYAIQNSDSKGQSRADPLQHHVREMNPSDSFPGGKKATAKAKDKPRDSQPARQPGLNHRAWSQRTLAITGIFVVAVAALGSYLARQARTAPSSAAEAAPLIAAAPAPTPIS